METHLELKHLAPYLPYGLKMKLLNYPIGEGIRTLELDCGHDFNFYLSNNYVRPILRPLSNLTENHVDDSPYLTKVQLEEEILNGGCPYVIWIDLVQQHFDVFDLIDSGLAIDINTISHE